MVPINHYAHAEIFIVALLFTQQTNNIYSTSSFIVLTAETGRGDAAVLDRVVREGLSDWVAFRAGN